MGIFNTALYKNVNEYFRVFSITSEYFFMKNINVQYWILNTFWKTYLLYSYEYMYMYSKYFDLVINKLEFFINIVDL